MRETINIFNMEEVRQVIRAERRSRNWSQKKLADILGKTPQYISQVETGKDSLSFDMANKILSVFDLKIDIIILPTQ